MADKLAIILDVLAALAIAAGISAGMYSLIGWWALVIGGGVLLGMVRLRDWIIRRAGGGTA